ncbi:hypothetical protein [Priestia endophytica]|uniref:Uncharacterized protein n=1 Tax=Priestia endophytica DSM 13796 TaxID=1121089 RepID=A0A1I6BZX6_9BACI|nr:hypothetical protein [Priestia endophytica]KYG33474.1 hypothetical protein AZF06_21765 [Priestia endophytica]SFQ86473.1 hypothetical protein SAMN02745910_04648 [Priestia endophytica DSM 13796]
MIKDLEKRKHAEKLLEEKFILEFSEEERKNMRPYRINITEISYSITYIIQEATQSPSSEWVYLQLDYSARFNEVYAYTFTRDNY